MASRTPSDPAHEPAPWPAGAARGGAPRRPPRRGRVRPRGAPRSARGAGGARRDRRPHRRRRSAPDAREADPRRHDEGGPLDRGGGRGAPGRAVRRHARASRRPISRGSISAGITAPWSSRALGRRPGAREDGAEGDPLRDGRRADHPAARPAHRLFSRAAGRSSARLTSDAAGHRGLPDDDAALPLRAADPRGRGEGLDADREAATGPGSAISGCSITDATAEVPLFRLSLAGSCVRRAPSAAPSTTCSSCADPAAGGRARLRGGPRGAGPHGVGRSPRSQLRAAPSSLKTRIELRGPRLTGDPARLQRREIALHELGGPDHLHRGRGRRDVAEELRRLLGGDGKATEVDEDANPPAVERARALLVLRGVRLRFLRAHDALQRDRR